MLDRDVVIRIPGFVQEKRARTDQAVSPPHELRADQGKATVSPRSEPRNKSGRLPSGKAVRNVPIQCHEMKKDGAAAALEAAPLDFKSGERRQRLATKFDGAVQFRFRNPILAGVFRLRVQIAPPDIGFEPSERATSATCRIAQFLATMSAGAAPRSGPGCRARRRQQRGKSSRQALRQSGFGGKAEIAMRFPRIADRHPHIADPGRNKTRRERNIANLRDDLRQLSDLCPGSGTYIKHLRFTRDRHSHGPTQRPDRIIDINKVANLGPVPMNLDRGPLEYAAG